jgi:hypothetical protein
MPKRNRGEHAVQRFTAGPLDEATGQRPVFPEIGSLSGGDTEWVYDDGADDIDEEGYGYEDLAGERYTSDALDYSEWDATAGVEIRENEATDRENGDEPDGEVEEEEEWDIEPQTEALSYLNSVRIEAKALPSVTYTSQNSFPQINTVESTKEPTSLPKTFVSIESDSVWRSQFLNYYMRLRKTLANAPEPNLSQDELDSLLHINPNNRPTTSDQEDRLWRLKTLDQPSIVLLSMLDQQRTIHLLTHLRKKMSTSVKPEQCMWLVFLLARLGDPGVLKGDEVDLLRRIGRKCLTVRKTLDENDDKVILGTVEMVICIIKHFYAQKDLEETFEESAQ